MSVGVWTVSVVLSVVLAESALAKLVMSRDALIASGQTEAAVYRMPVDGGLRTAGRGRADRAGVARALTPAAAGG